MTLKKELLCANIAYMKPLHALDVKNIDLDDPDLIPTIQDKPSASLRDTKKAFYRKD